LRQRILRVWNSREAYLDSWRSIEEGRVELESIIDHIVRQLAPEYPVVHVEADEEDTWRTQWLERSSRLIDMLQTEKERNRSKNRSLFKAHDSFGVAVDGLKSLSPQALGSCGPAVKKFDLFV
jgi:hypothetical protein